MKSLFCTLLLVCLCSVALIAAGIDGTWYQEVTRDGPDGQMTIKTTVNLKSADNKLTGTVLSAWGDREMPAAEIQDGKVEGSKFSFTVKREFGGNEMVIKYQGTIEGDVLKGESTFEGMDRVMPFEWKRK
jgi:hypothetical protein